MNNKHFKKILAVFMATVLVFSIMPINVFSTETTSEYSIDGGNNITNQNTQENSTNEVSSNATSTNEATLSETVSSAISSEESETNEIVLYTALASEDYVYEIGGVRTVFLSDSVTVSYNSTEYTAYQSLTEAFSALGTDGGNAIVSGTFTPTDVTSDTSFADPERGEITVTGATGASTDIIVMNYQLIFKYKIVFDDVKIQTDDYKYMYGHEVTFTENFKSNYKFYFAGKNGADSSGFNNVISGGTFGYVNYLGLHNVKEPAVTTINGGTVHVWGAGESWSSSDVLDSNLFLIVNGGTVPSTLDFNSKSPAYTSGVKTVILNNGTYDSVTVSNFDVVVKSAIGGTVSVEDYSASIPTFIFTPDEEKFPYVDGVALTKTGDTYKYTPETSTNVTINITWQGEDKAENIDGVRTVFLSDSETITYNDTEYTAYQSLSEAFGVLGTLGGKAIVSGTFTPTDVTSDSSFVDTERGEITVTGATGASTDIIVMNYQLTFKYKIVFDDVKIQTGNYKYMYGHEVTFTENFKSNYMFYFAGKNGADSSGFSNVISGGTFGYVNFLGLHTVQNPAVTTINGGTVHAWGAGENWSSSDVLDSNLFLIVNGGTVPSTLDFNAKGYTHTSGVRTVILNNGKADSVTVSNFDLVVKSAAGGTVSVEDYSASIPTFILTPNTGMAPYVDGTIILKTDGVYKYTPDTAAATLNVTWQEAEEDFAENVDGERVVFLSDSETITYNDTEYTAYQSLSEALGVLGSLGGKAIVSGTFTPADSTGDNTFADPTRGEVTVTGATGASTDVFVLNHRIDFKSKIIFDDIKIQTSDYKYIYGHEVTFTENFKSNYMFYFAGKSGTDSTGFNNVISGGTFGYVNYLGLHTVKEPAVTTINGGTVHAWGAGEDWSSSDVLDSNLFLIVNGGTVPSTLDFNSKSPAYTSGVKTVILNNGKSDSVTVSNFDIVVKSKIGGTVTVEDYTSSIPTFILTPEEGKTPQVDGVDIEKTGDVYKYTPNELSETDTTEIVVTWTAPDVTAQINGKRTVFLSQSKMVFYDGKTYSAFQSLTEAFNALGEDGGVAMVSGEFTPTDATADDSFTGDGVDCGSVTVTGVAGAESDIIVLEYRIRFKNKLTFDDVTVQVVGGSGKGSYIYGHDVTFTENVVVDGNLYYSTRAGTDSTGAYLTVSGGRFEKLNFMGIHKAQDPIVITINSGEIWTFAAGENWSSGDNLDSNLFIIINGGKYEIKNIDFADAAYTSGVRTVIFNNGRADGFTVSEDYEFVVNSAQGGIVSVEDYDAETPTFILTPDGTNVPFVDGVQVESEAGVYKITPEKAESGTKTVNVTWRKPVTIEFNINNATGTTPDSQTVFTGDVVTLPDATNFSREPYIFKGWSTDSEAKQGDLSITVTDNVILYAVWLINVPELDGTPNYAANGLTSVKTEYISPDSQDIAASVVAAGNSPEFMSTYECVYAFNIYAYNQNGVTDSFANGIDFIIPIDPPLDIDRSAGGFLKLYRASGSGYEFIQNLVFEDDGSIEFTAYKSGSYFALLNTPDKSDYLYSVSKVGEKVYVNVFFKGNAAQSGFFTLKYNADAITLDSVNYAEGVESVGSNFGLLSDTNGAFSDVWHTKVFFNSNVYSPIATLNFTVKDETADISITAGDTALGTVKSIGTPVAVNASYIPYYESSEIFWQPADINITENVVAMVNGTIYATFSEAISNAVAGDTVILSADAEISADTAIPTGVVLKILDGVKITLTNGAILTTNNSIYSSVSADTAVGVRNDGDLFIYKASEFAKDTIVNSDVQIKALGKLKLGVISKIAGSKNQNNYTNYGIAYISESLSEGKNTTLATSQINEISLLNQNGNFKYYTSNDTHFYVTSYITDIALEQYGSEFVIRPFVQYMDGDYEYTIYAEYDTACCLSVYDVALSLLTSNNVSKANKEYYQTNIIDAYISYIANKKSKLV